MTDDLPYGGELIRYHGVTRPLSKAEAEGLRAKISAKRSLPTPDRWIPIGPGVQLDSHVWAWRRHRAFQRWPKTLAYLASH